MTSSYGLKSSSDWFTVTELEAGLFGIGEFGHVEKVISFLLIGREQNILIDTGFGFFSMKSVVNSITKLPCKVLNTHSHFDHLGSNFEFKDVAMYDHPDNRKAASEGFNSDFLASWIAPNQFVNAVPREVPDPYIVKPFPYAQFFTEGACFSNSAFNLEAIHTPGHSDDSVCFYDAERGWLFSGDLLYDGPIYIEKKGGLLKFRASLTKLTKLSKLTRIFSSHNAYEFSLDKLYSLVKALDSLGSTELKEEFDFDGVVKLVPC